MLPRVLSRAAARGGWIRDPATLAPDERCEGARLGIDLSSWVFPDRPFRQKIWIGEPAERPSFSPLCRWAVRAAYEPTPTSPLVLGITTGI